MFQKPHQIDLVTRDMSRKEHSHSQAAEPFSKIPNPTSPIPSSVPWQRTPKKTHSFTSSNPQFSTPEASLISPKTPQVRSTTNPPNYNTYESSPSLGVSESSFSVPPFASTPSKNVLQDFQEAAFNAVKSGRDTILVWPTGAGKSYLIMKNIEESYSTTVVLTPTLSLMTEYMELKISLGGVICT